ncbi:MAG: hypothetical protein QOI30_1545, partial [Mycobacterium sp.]|nr:hypothetical protein [Mycobacterium sp.]
MAADPHRGAERPVLGNDAADPGASGVTDDCCLL